MLENLENPQVQGDPNQSGAATPVAPVTPAEPVAPATPSAPPSDAVDQKQAEYERQLAKYEADIRALKSNSDKRLNEAQRQFEERQRQMQRELQTLRMASMDEDERKQYETNLAQEHQQELEQEVARLRQTSQEFEANLKAVNYFLHQGVPADKLVIDQGYDALFNSGMDWITNELKRVRTPNQSQPQSPQQSPLPTPPVVATGTPGAVAKPSWSDLRTKYGDDETIYRLVEAGRLPRDIIPG